jgi:hypothetical protein
MSVVPVTAQHDTEGLDNVGCGGFVGFIPALKREAFASEFL